MAMLALAHAALGDRIEVATVDHGLRSEAAGECALVARHCASHGIPCQILSVNVGGGNLQDRARAARYAALGAWGEARGLTAIATAHHADDQAETILMRLNRGSGLAGLAGIRSSGMVEKCGLPVIRPLLSFRKAELRGVVERVGIPYAEDPSNRDETFERVRIRRALADADWLDPVALARSAAHLEEAEQALQSLADRAWADGAKTEHGRVLVPNTHPIEISARLIARAITVLGGLTSPGEVLAYLKTAKPKGNLAGILLETCGDAYICTPEPPRRTG
ncbi:tRNA lysidine(34) synthetase TilS [Qipengyuania spongiae]|uniref:tRNA(Ile)-lysidine synthase n=1 Tax=Qipengyuania spongiae TaxID=2909673 RepID=A0ABY5T5V0_9SPHN|nr:tRNA lysidine(34) synthetase TilS [Qipengyuania spongiae]